ncbi:MAG: Uma2 family endonuclease [Cyanobacteria bacterium SBLK]|nr:Uma2 family endonuclease [Cyanobacteria bacterium SBLK]
MSTTQTKILTETWSAATWDEYLQAADNPIYEKAKFYYYNRQLRIEMTPLGNDHASDHSIITYAINLYATVNEIELNSKDNCSYRKTGVREAQPDLSYYIGETVDAVPYGTGIIHLDDYPPPTLVIEIANTSLADDRGTKRLLYEDLEVGEYWIVDVQRNQILAFSIENSGSHRINISGVLPGLEMSLLEEALRQTRQTNHSRVGAWLLSRFQDQ